MSKKLNLRVIATTVLVVLLAVVAGFVIVRIIMGAPARPARLVGMCGWIGLILVALTVSVERRPLGNQWVDWLGNWRVRRYPMWAATACLMTNLSAAIIMHGWKPGASLVTWLVLVVLMTGYGFAASAVNRGCRLLDPEYQDELVRDQELDWRLLPAREQDRLAHDMFVGKRMAVAVDIIIPVVLSIVLMFAHAPLTRLHNESVHPTTAVVQPTNPVANGGLLVDPGPGQPTAATPNGVQLNPAQPEAAPTATSGSKGE